MGAAWYAVVVDVRATPYLKELSDKTLECLAARREENLYLVWLLYVRSGNRPNSAPHPGYFAFQKG